MSFIEVIVREGSRSSATLRVYISAPQSASPRVNVEVIDAAPLNPDTHGRHEVVLDVEAWRAVNRAVEALLPKPCPF